MKISWKHIVASSMLFIGMFLCYDISFQQSDSSSSSSFIEICSENNSISEGSSIDFDINEEDQIIYRVPFSTWVEINSNHPHVLIAGRSVRPFFNVWQPPKLS